MGVAVTMTGLRLAATATVTRATRATTTVVIGPITIAIIVTTGGVDTTTAGATETAGSIVIVSVIVTGLAFPSVMEDDLETIKTRAAVAKRRESELDVRKLDHS